MDTLEADIGSPLKRTPPRPHSPALKSPNFTKQQSTSGLSAAINNVNNANAAGLQLDMSLEAAVAALVHYLVQPLAAHCSHAKVMELRTDLTSALEDRFRPSWKESNPHVGSGLRSLISDHRVGLPPVLKEVARKHDIDPNMWTKAIATLRRRKLVDLTEAEDWEVWCDPGMVVWRWGGWGWDEPEFDPIKRPRESFHVIWQAAPAPSEVTSPLAATTTPSQRSRAIPIRAPSLLHIPATPSPAPSSASLTTAAVLSPRSPSPLLPAADIVSQHRNYPSQSPTHSRQPSFARAHKGNQSSTSSNSSDSSDTNSHTQLLTPGSRPGSADLLPEPRNAKGMEETPRGRDRSPAPEPTVTPYDGGNVTVLGGGTKLGGSRPSSVMSSRGDRTRSPSVSIASRALLTAVGPNSNGAPGSPRKPRTRRRIIPTHIGYFGQPGIGAPMLAAFGSHKHQPGQPYWPQGQPGVGVGVAPPPVGIKRV